MRETENVEAKDLREGDRILGKNSILLLIVSATPLNSTEMLLVGRDKDNADTLGAIPNATIVRKVIKD